MRDSSGWAAIFVLLVVACSRTEVTHSPASGPIAAEPGGVQGYQHGNDRSKFVAGADKHEVAEYGFVKVVGSEGTFAVDAHNGLAVAIPNARSARTMSTSWYTRDSAQHNKLVMDYFAGAGLPKDQIGGVHATTSMAATATGEQAPRPQPSVGGYQSIIERKLEDMPIVDSVAWARMNDAGESLTEWVYWPAIPAQAMADARRLRALFSNDSERTAYLAKLPPNLPPGAIVVRHSSATSAVAFEAFASYDVPERRLGPEVLIARRTSERAIVIVRHFDLSGTERMLPQEKAQLKEDFPKARREPK